MARSFVKNLKNKNKKAIMVKVSMRFRAYLDSVGYPRRDVAMQRLYSTNNMFQCASTSHS